MPAVVQVKAPVGSKVIVPPPVVNGAIAVIVTTAAVPEIKVMSFIGAIVAALAIVDAAAVVPITADTARLVAVAAPSTGVTMTILVLRQLLMLPLATVPRAGPDKTGVVNIMLVLVQALMLPLATVPRIGPVIVGLVNNWVFVSLFVVPPCTIGIMSEDAAADAAGKLEMATVVIIKSSQRRCCSVDDWRLCRKASPSHRQGC